MAELQVLDRIDRITELLEEIKEQWKRPVIIVNMANEEDLERVRETIEQALRGQS